MASLAARAQEMLDSDSEFRAQFDRSSASYHGHNRPKDYLEPVPLNLPGGQGARVPTEMKAHANWTALAVRDDGEGGGAGSGGAATSYGPEWEEACRLREAMAALKKAVSADDGGDGGAGGDDDAAADAGAAADDDGDDDDDSDDGGGAGGHGADMNFAMTDGGGLTMIRSSPLVPRRSARWPRRWRRWSRRGRSWRSSRR
jgi:hypothetical protein